MTRNFILPQVRVCGVIRVEGEPPVEIDGGTGVNGSGGTPLNHSHQGARDDLKSQWRPGVHYGVVHPHLLERKKWNNRFTLDFLFKAVYLYCLVLLTRLQFIHPQGLGVAIQGQKNIQILKKCTYLLVDSKEILTAMRVMVVSIGSRGSHIPAITPRRGVAPRGHSRYVRSPRPYRNNHDSNI